MLKLDRKVGEEVIIGDDIKLMVVRIDGDKVRIGIEAPKAIPVHRAEIHASNLKRERERREGGL